jgi:hypothetical protein
MMWFKKKEEPKAVEKPKPTYYIDTPVEVKKEYLTETITDTTGATVNEVDEDYIIYSAKTGVGSVTATAEIERYVGSKTDTWNPRRSEKQTLFSLQRRLHIEVARIKELQADLPLGTWLPVDWSNPNKSVMVVGLHTD